MRDALAARPWVRALVMPDPQALGDAFGELRAGGIRRISAIGGRTVATAIQ